MKILVLSILLFCTTAFALEPSEIEVEFSIGGPFEEVKVKLLEESAPFLLSYDAVTKKCTLSTNVLAPQPSGLQRDLMLLHEAGRCHALRRGLVKPEDHSTKYAKCYGDVFAVAWIHRYRQLQFQTAFNMLLSMRYKDRKMNPTVDTIPSLSLARISLPAKEHPADFAARLLPK